MKESINAMSHLDDLSKIFLSKIDEIKSDIRDIRVSQARTERDLVHHIRRTDLAEKRIEQVHTDLTTRHKDLETRIEPIRRHVEGFNVLLKAVGVASLLAGLAFTCVKLADAFFEKPTKGESRHAEVPKVRSLRVPKGK